MDVTMIRINEDYEAERYTYGWMLHRWRDGENPKTKEPTRTCRTTYYGNLTQLCDAVIDDAAGGADDARQLQQIVSSAQADLKLALSPNTR